MESTLSIPVVKKPGTVAFTGNPNTGKSTLFNLLTGFRQRVGNYPGVTVEKRTGMLKAGEDAPPIELVDLPGTYSLAPHAADEAVVLDVLLGQQKGVAAPDLIVVVVDAAHLHRNLFLTTQVLEIGKPVVVALNMMDTAEAHGISIDAEALARELGVPVVPVVATKGRGVDTLTRVILDSLSAPPSDRCADFPECVCAELDGLTESICASINDCPVPPSRAETLQTLLSPGGYHEQRLVKRCGKSLAEELVERRRRIIESGESLVEVEARVRYAWIDRVVGQVTTRSRHPRRSRSAIVDRLLTHRLLGLVVFLGMMTFCFQAIYSWAGPLMDAIDGSLTVLGGLIAAAMPAGALRSLVVDGVIAGVGAVLVFLPQILILFFFIALLEDCGYMARAAFLLDRWMGFLGLNGKSFIPLLTSFACAVPAIMSTRSIENRRDRFITILIAPLMSCSARLPVYMLLIGALIPATPLLGGIVNLQTVTLLSLYALGMVVAVLIALLLKKTIFKGEAQSFLMELPSYKWPSPKTILYRVYEQGREFCVSAGTIIFAVTMVVWALGYYPHSTSMAKDLAKQREDARIVYETRLADIALVLDPALTAETVTAHGPVAEVLAKIDEAEKNFESFVAARELAEGSAEGQFAVDAHYAWIDALVKGAGAAGVAAVHIQEAELERATLLARIERSESGAYLRDSFLGRMGHFIEPAVKPLGWDWRIGTAAIASFPAREVVVATMGTIYNLGADEDGTSKTLRQRLVAATWPDGRKVFNVPVALSLMVFFALCCQCGGTLAVIRRETNSWRYPILTFTYMTTLAYLGAMATFQLASRLG